MNIDYKRLFVIIAGEEKRYKEEVNQSLYNAKKLQLAQNVNKNARADLAFIQGMAGDKRNIQTDFFRYVEQYKDIRFDGRVIIRPYRTLTEAAQDGVMGVYDAAMIASTLKETSDGYLFVVRLANYPDRAFGYVLYDENGNIKRTNQAFNLEIKDERIIRYLKLFSRDILLPALKQKDENKTA